MNFGNGWEGHTYGADVWASYSPFSWWRLDPGVSVLHKDFQLKPGEQDLAGTQSVLGHDPEYQIFLRSYMDLPNDVQLFVGLRQIGALRDLGIPAYFEANVRIGWAITPTLELSLVGQNLVHAEHAEGSPFNEIPRSFYVGARWKF